MLPSLLLLVVLGQAAPPASQGAAPPAADELIARVRERYGHCRTYRDDALARHGYGERSSSAEGDRWSIRFERAGRFRIEHGAQSRWEYGGEEVLWRDGEDWQRWERGRNVASPLDPRRETRDSGMIGPFVDWILPLLDAELPRGEHVMPTWQEARATGTVTSEPVGDVACRRVELALPSARAKVWIAEDGGIRRLVVDGTTGPRSHDELELAPEFDVALDPAELELSPPGESGVKPSRVVHLLIILSIVTMGMIGVLLGLRLSRTGRPFTVSAGLIGWFGATLGAAELLGRFIDRIDVFLDLNLVSLVVAAGVAAAAWPIVRFLRGRAGFYVVGVDHATFVIAMRAVANALHLPAQISAATPKVKIDDVDFEVAKRERWSMFGLIGSGVRSRDLLERLRPLVGACFASEALSTKRSAGVRCIAWGAAMIVAGVFFGGVLLSVLDHF